MLRRLGVPLWAAGSVGEALALTSSFSRVPGTLAYHIQQCIVVVERVM